MPFAAQKIAARGGYLVVDGASNQDRTDDPRFTRGLQSATYEYLCDKAICGKWAFTSLAAVFQNTGCYTKHAQSGGFVEGFVEKGYIKNESICAKAKRLLVCPRHMG